MKRLLAVAVAIAFAALAHGQQLRRGDLLVGGVHVPGFCVWPTGSTDYFDWVQDAATARSEKVSIAATAWSEAAQSAFVVVAPSTFARVANDGTLIAIASLPAKPTALAPDAKGNFYVATTDAIVKVDANGKLLDRIELPEHSRAVADMDLAADQCTLYVTHLDGIRAERVDVCRHLFLSEVPLSAGVESLRVLPDGTLLVTRLGTTIERLDATTGATLHTYEFPRYENPQRSRIAAVRLHSNGERFTAAIDHKCGFGIAFYDYFVDGVTPPALRTTVFPNAYVTAAIVGEWRAVVTTPPARRQSARH